jgi:short-subunit dehydrogenase
MIKSPTRPLAVVTGASSGIGLELAKQFAQHGFDLLIAAEDDGIESAAVAIEWDEAVVETAKVDLATREGVDALYQRIKALGRPVEAIAINAGVGVAGPFVDTDLDADLRMIYLNAAGAVQLAKYIVRDMVVNGRGRILFTASIAADMPGPYYATYAASKAFVLSFAEALRYELKDSGITVTALQPGATDTNFFQRAGMEDTRAGTGKKDDPAEVARDGFEALMDGKDKVIAGSFRNWMQDAMAQVMPEPAKAAAHARLTEPGSGKK